MSYVENLPLLISVTEAGKLLGLSRSTIYELVAAKKIPLIKIGRASRVPVAGIRAFADALTAHAAHAA